MSRRTRIIDLLKSSERPLTAREISIHLGIGEPTLAKDLLHIARTIRTGGGNLMTVPASCLGCGFLFDSSRTTSPSKCPRCRSLHLRPPSFAIDGSW